MRKKYKVLGVVVPILVVLCLAAWYLHRTNIPVLEPKGPIADKELHLMILATLLMLIVVIPVFVLTFLIVWRYRDGRKAKYNPTWDGNRAIEATWWLIPSILIVILATVAWRSSYQLNPYAPIASNQPTLNIQVVALDWKWLFIYPQQKIASVNYLQIPRNTPVHFYITADAPMNSFWVPQLSGQIYAMPGMQTQLNLMATSYGTFHGWSANISGRGFASMEFNVRSSTQASFKHWVAINQQSPKSLSAQMYEQLAKPSVANPAATYQLADKTLFNDVMMQYMMPGMSVTDPMSMPVATTTKVVPPTPTVKAKQSMSNMMMPGMKM